MKFVFVLYRWDRSIIGGAEIHHQRLIDDLIELGHEVEIFTTTGKDIPAVAHWGVEWHEEFAPGISQDGKIKVHRFPLNKASRNMIGLGSKFLQRQLDRIPFCPSKDKLKEAVIEKSSGSFLSLWDGWYHPEGSGENIWCWSHPESSLLLKTKSKSGTLRINASLPNKKPKNFSIYCNGQKLELNGDGKFVQSIYCEVKLDDLNENNLIELKIHPGTKVLRDHRHLGFLATEISFESDDVKLSLDFHQDIRAHGRAHPEIWWQILSERSKNISSVTCKLFDWLRGPRSKALKKNLKSIPKDTDLVVACNLPWSVIPMVAEQCHKPWAAMALWHLDDDYYYWPHYINALKKARFVLANTPYSSEKFFPRFGIDAPFVGPGIVDESETSEQQNEKKTESFSVLTVCRKSPEKRYDMVIEAVAKVREIEPRAKLTFIGPDADQRAIPDWVNYTGRVKDEILHEAYAKCDVFVLMSESESFGMVLAEAWLRKKPVIANRVCGPAASLISDGIDGRVVSGVDELAEALKDYKNDEEKRNIHGIAGYEKTKQEYVQRAATKRFLSAVEKYVK